jgi:hypothetical protein
MVGVPDNSLASCDSDTHPSRKLAAKGAVRILLVFCFNWNTPYKVGLTLSQHQKLGNRMGQEGHTSKRVF